MAIVRTGHGPQYIRDISVVEALPQGSGPVKRRRETVAERKARLRREALDTTRYLERMPMPAATFIPGTRPAVPKPPAPVRAAPSRPRDRRADPRTWHQRTPGQYRRVVERGELALAELERCNGNMRAAAAVLGIAPAGFALIVKHARIRNA